MKVNKKAIVTAVLAAVTTTHTSLLNAYPSGDEIFISDSLIIKFIALKPIFKCNDFNSTKIWPFFLLQLLY